MTTPDKSPDEIVGHKTFKDERGCFRHEPLTRAEADALWESAEKAKSARAEKYPTTEDAIRGLWDAHYRLKELGWKEADYAPPDGKERDTISLGSTGIHKAYCEPRSDRPSDKWWWHPGDGDLYPHDPILYWPGDKP